MQSLVLLHCVYHISQSELFCGRQFFVLFYMQYEFWELIVNGVIVEKEPADAKMHKFVTTQIIKKINLQWIWVSMTLWRRFPSLVFST